MKKYMPKVWVIEGPDNAGKSTIISELCKLLPNQPHIIHCVGIKRDTPEESIQASKLYYSQMFDIVKYCLNMLNVDVILDRSHIGDAVYPQIYRGCTEQQCSYIYALETLDKTQVTGIYVMSNPDTLMARDDGLSQSKNNKLNIIKELNLFEIAIAKSKYDFIKLNTSFTTKKTIVPILKGIVNADIQK